MTKLHDLHQRGQSVWFDFIERDLLRSGGLERLVADGVRGLTSNPTIFQKAISGSDLYDDQIRALLTSGSNDTAAIFERIALEDIKAAADELRSVYDGSDGEDGFVSFEVSPHLAADTQGTIADATRLWTLIDRPNIMIKVPATPQGIPAVEELIAAGINVNVTLMFSLADYEAVAQAYLRGLARAARPETVASVASFFVSRVDSKLDGALDKVGSEDAMELRGEIAVANSKLAYRRYQELFEGEAFESLADRGARPQRVLWASTSTKNPAYRDVLYVEELIGSSTVNTMPPATIDAFLDHGEIRGATVTDGVEAARETIDRLAVLGIDLDELTAQLQTEGVTAFADSYDDLLTTLDEKIAALR